MPATVTVFCKLPAGLRLRLHEVREENELVMGGGSRKVKLARPMGEPVVINGTAAPHGHAPRDKAGNYILVSGGYAATPNVDKDFWDKWMYQNNELDLVRNHLIYAHEKPAEAEAWARDHVSIRTGLEPLTPTIADGGGRVIQTDPRTPRSIAAADKQAA